jgi:hypothetical protein
MHSPETISKGCSVYGRVEQVLGCYIHELLTDGLEDVQVDAWTRCSLSPLNVFPSSVRLVSTSSSHYVKGMTIMVPFTCRSLPDMSDSDRTAIEGWISALGRQVGSGQCIHCISESHRPTQRSTGHQVTVGSRHPSC